MGSVFLIVDPLFGPAVDPTLGEIKWSQGYSYYLIIPFDSDFTCAKSVALWQFEFHEVKMNKCWTNVRSLTCAMTWSAFN